MYAKSAVYYDAIYAAVGKDYAREAEVLHALIQRHKRSSGNALLDVACGTGNHIVHLKRHYAVEGLDLDPDMLAIARRKHPDVVFHQGDMVQFDLGRQFDAVVCLFSAIAYALTPERLTQAVRTMARHAKPGGVVIAEPFIDPDKWQDGHINADFVNLPDLKVARMNVSSREGNIAVLDFHFMVATPSGIEHFNERHDLALFTHDEYLTAFRRAGLVAELTRPAETRQDRAAFGQYLERLSVRAGLIKLADRIENVRGLLTIRNDPGFVEQYLDETRELFLAPWIDRMHAELAGMLRAAFSRAEHAHTQT